jgi:hypothetical protein
VKIRVSVWQSVLDLSYLDHELQMADMDMDDAFNAFKSSSKGKARQENAEPNTDGLPWSVVPLKRDSRSKPVA